MALPALQQSPVQHVGLTRKAARSLTDEVRADAERLWAKLHELYEGGAHTALGYDSWGNYFTAEFGGSRSRAYQLLQAGKVLETVKDAGLPVPANDRQAVELAPLLNDPDQLREAWAEASANGEPTARDVREVVARRTAPAAPRATTTPSPIAQAIHDLYRATKENAATSKEAKQGANKRLADEWVSVSLYVGEMFKSAGVSVPKGIRAKEIDSNA